MGRVRQRGSGMTKKEREAQERELFENLEREKKLFWAIDKRLFQIGRDK